MITAIFIVRIASLHRRWGFDDATVEARKVHVNPVPRLGGVAILIGAWFAGSVLNRQDAVAGNFFLTLLMGSLPAFLVGLGEDLSGKLSPSIRLVGMTIASILIMEDLNITIIRTNVGPIDQWFSRAVHIVDHLPEMAKVPHLTAFAWKEYPLTALTICAATVAALLSITNGINLIDGLNGLAGFSSMLMFLGLGAVAVDVGDKQTASCAFVLAGAIAGFFVWNWPRGYLFMGDGGAYLIGFSLGALCIVLVQRNSAVSAWFAVLLLIYPLTEVGFSIWRRKFVKRRAIGLPDAAHLHHLVYRRIVRTAVGRTSAESKMIRNAFAAPYLWTMTAMSVFPAVALYQHSEILAACAFAFVFGYVWLYLRIIRLRIPNLLV